MSTSFSQDFWFRVQGFFEFQMLSSNYVNFLRFLLCLFIEVILKGTLFELEKNILIPLELQKICKSNLYYTNERKLPQESTNTQMDEKQRFCMLGTCCSSILQKFNVWCFRGYFRQKIQILYPGSSPSFPESLGTENDTYAGTTTTIKWNSCCRAPKIINQYRNESIHSQNCSRNQNKLNKIKT